MSAGTLMVCGTSSDAGKSFLVTGLCRAFARRGLKVAPFKGQNMALNAMVTSTGEEIGRAQWVQAVAASVEAEVAMNPVLLKPTEDSASQVVVMGRPWRTLRARDYQAAKPELVGVVMDAFCDLCERFDLVICEGAGSAAEINLFDNDLVNLGFADRAKVPAILVGDIDRGGVFAHLYGTVELLPDEMRSLVKGFVLNKFRGDRSLLGDATSVLERRTKIATIGVVPTLPGVPIDAEDSMSVPRFVQGDLHGGESRERGESVEIAVIRLPRISNFTDMDALVLEGSTRVRYVEHAGDLGRPDLIVVPGTKSTVADLSWLRETGLRSAILELVGPDRSGSCIVGICGGYQMLGSRIDDPLAVESHDAAADGLGLLDVTTVFEPEKTTGYASGHEVRSGHEVSGYEIRHGRLRVGPSATPWLAADSSGACSLKRRAGSQTALLGIYDPIAGIYGTSVHGLFECDAFRKSFLQEVAGRRGKKIAVSNISFAGEREAYLDRIADVCEKSLDMAAIEEIIEAGVHR